MPSVRSAVQKSMLLLLLGLFYVAPVHAETGDDLAARERMIEMEARRHPESREARLSLAKLLHFRAVDGDAKAASQSTELLEGLASERHDDPIVLAYLGSARLVAARLSWNPWRKVSLVKEGLDLMDRSVARAPEDPEVRFLRGASTRPLPRYFGRGELSSRDLSEAASGARPAYASGRLDKELAAAIFYLYGFTLLDHGDRDGTERAWRTAIEIAPTSKAGRKAAGRLAAH